MFRNAFPFIGLLYIITYIKASNNKHSLNVNPIMFQNISKNICIIIVIYYTVHIKLSRTDYAP